MIFRSAKIFHCFLSYCVILILRWCSLFNADLALSVTMTTMSTLLSVIMLPVNLVLYASTTYSDEVVKSLDWKALFVSLVVVIGGIFTGLLCSATVNSPRFNLIANKVNKVTLSFIREIVLFNHIQLSITDRKPIRSCSHYIFHRCFELTS
jgi:predicted Na+-dependent transporter